MEEGGGEEKGRWVSNRKSFHRDKNLTKVNFRYSHEILKEKIIAPSSALLLMLPKK
jgi:hypothetical protein